MSESSARSHTFTNLSIPQAYEAYLVAQLFAPWARTLLDVVGIGPGAAVLDVASGTGIVARLAAERVGATGQVIATDISPAMVAYAAELAPAATIRYIVCAADALAARDASQDVVLCQQGLQFFPDKAAAVREMKRVVKPGGRVGVAVWAAEQPFGFYGPVIEAVARVIPEPYPRAYDVRSYMMTAEEVAALLRAAGFSEIRVEQRAMTASWSTLDEALATIQGTTYGPLVTGLPPAQQEAVHRAVAAGLGEQTPGGGVSCQTFANLACAVA
jgi:ubiquinone/menaquinone biosynthesis C-methylase UbiE